ncbi:hypothetical protein UY3_11350 [Chelonia mydas]|uniref:Uncharacterized protein n=1 Tax=Chelonia mydas TaxID=8469 RepID=M7B100_CHEMY|nr:hypothetical protein UY3_11350 [Chelonia mydas]
MNALRWRQDRGLHSGRDQRSSHFEPPGHTTKPRAPSLKAPNRPPLNRRCWRLPSVAPPLGVPRRCHACTPPPMEPTPTPVPEQDPGLPGSASKTGREVPEEQEDPVPPLASLLSSPDEAVAGTSVSGPPSIDSRAHQDLLRRVARNMGLQAQEVVELEDPMVNILALEDPSGVALPIVKSIQANAKTVWQTPASIPPTAKYVERKYFIPSKGYKYLFTHLQPCSLVVAAVNEKERHGQQAPAPDAKCLDFFEHKVYSTGVRAVSNSGLPISRQF